MKIKCVVACTNAQGDPDLFSCVVECSKEQYDNGDHYDMAKDLARDDDYEGPDMVAFDENDGPDWLFRQLFGSQRGKTMPYLPESGMSDDDVFQFVGMEAEVHLKKATKKDFEKLAKKFGFTASWNDRPTLRRGVEEYRLPE